MGLPFKGAIIKFALERVFKRMDDIIEDQISKIEVLKKIMIAIENGATLENVIDIYVEHAKNPTLTKVDDVVDRIFSVVDEVLIDVQEKPIKEVIEKWAADVRIPDFDDDPENDISLSDFLLDIIQDVATGKKGDEPR